MSERAAPGVHEERIDVAVIAALELDDLVAPGEAAREADARHCRFGAAVHHPHLLDRRHMFADELRHLHFERIRNSEAEAARRGVADSLDDDLRRVAENRWSPRADVIDVFFAIDVPDFGAGGALDEERLAIQAAERADGRVNAAGNSLACGGEKFGGARMS